MFLISSWMAVHKDLDSKTQVLKYSLLSWCGTLNGPWLMRSCAIEQHVEGVQEVICLVVSIRSQGDAELKLLLEEVNVIMPSYHLWFCLLSLLTILLFNCKYFCTVILKYGIEFDCVLVPMVSILCPCRWRTLLQHILCSRWKMNLLLHDCFEFEFCLMQRW